MRSQIFRQVARKICKQIRCKGASRSLFGIALRQYRIIIAVHMQADVQQRL